jgi:hypothetical protein
MYTGKIAVPPGGTAKIQPIGLAAVYVKKIDNCYFVKIWIRF